MNILNEIKSDSAVFMTCYLVITLTIAYIGLSFDVHSQRKEGFFFLVEVPPPHSEPKWLLFQNLWIIKFASSSSVDDSRVVDLHRDIKLVDSLPRRIFLYNGRLQPLFNWSIIHFTLKVASLLRTLQRLQKWAVVSQYTSLAESSIFSVCFTEH